MTDIRLSVVLVLSVCWALCGADLPPSGLNELYNSRVVSADLVRRPKQGMPSWVPNTYFTSHSGVRVTLDNGKQYLIHKGPGYGKASDTVVTDARHMSNKWQVKKTENFGGSRTVGDMVKAGGSRYSILRGKHCHTAAKNMMRLGRRRRH
ncbi:hypothetical protein WMY93_010245 [Mugilogobius chulae]|uniref:Uncharacterized protein n=1 Tax=Mugilogobius chulae TaxID=88201 RepID=A0AAW0PCI8_9GOBI